MPNRIIKESICRSDSIDSLSWFEEVLFYRLIVVCDDYGRFDGRPAIIRGSCFPLKDIRLEQIEDALKGLAIAGMVRRYSTEDGTFLQLTAWGKHQQTRAKNSKYPAPDENTENQIPGGSDSGFYMQEKSSETACNHMISDDSKCSRNRESIYGNRESICERETRACARGEVRLFETFLSAYPKPCNRHMAEIAYADLILEDVETEDNLVACAKNYAEACRIEKTSERYIKNAENFLKDFVFTKYLPGKYQKPEKKVTNRFNDFDQRQYDHQSLERMLLMGGTSGGVG